MKKFILILSVMLIWGCSQADESDTKEAVNSKVDQAQKQTAEKVDNKVAEVTEEATAKAQDMADKTMAKVTDKAAAANNDGADYQAGIHYNVITPAWDTGSDDVIVYEFFSYMCPHCNTFQPYMKQLEKDVPEGVKIQRVPVVFYPQWRPHAQAYYTFEAMNILDQAHEPFFAAIHQHKKQFRSIEDVADWAAASFNVDKDKFLSTAKSFMIDGQIRKGMQMMQAMNVTSTPTLVVNGKYSPNREQMKSRQDEIDVAEALVLKEIK